MQMPTSDISLLRDLRNLLYPLMDLSTLLFTDFMSLPPRTGN